VIKHADEINNDFQCVIDVDFPLQTERSTFRGLQLQQPTCGMQALNPGAAPGSPQRCNDAHW
jgi:hypothetical protein